MEILDLRHLRSRDLGPLLEEEKTLWKTKLHWDYTSSSQLIQRYVDAAALPGYAAMEAGRAVGYSFYVCENLKGVVGDVFAADLPCAEAIESQLLTHIIETLQATPGIRRIEAQLMTLRHEPSSDFFGSRNLESFRRQFMILPLNGAGTPEPVSVAGVTVSPWDPRWTSDAAELIARAYHGHIDSSISDQYRSRAGALRFLDNIIHYPGCGDFDANCSFLAYQQGGQRLCGMVLSSVVGQSVHHITQVCVDPAVQRGGIGRMMIFHILQKLRQRGARAVTLTVTNANASAIRLYRNLNFSTLKEFYAFAWEASS